MISKQELNRMADQVELRLNQLKMPTDVTGGQVYPVSGFVEFIIQPQYRDGKIPPVDAIIKAQNDIANVIGTKELRIYQNSKAQVCVEVQLFMPPPPTAESLIRQIRNKYQLPMGRTREGNVLFFDFNHPACAHLLISGTTGSGKTALAHSMILAACQIHTPEELKLVIIDYNNVEADWFYPNVSAHIMKNGLPKNSYEAAQILTWIATDMVKGRRPYKTIIFIDELAGICSDSEEALKMIELITQQGRKYGVHIIAATQKPANTVLGPLLKSNMRRVCGKVNSPEDSKVATGMSGVGCEKLSDKGGQFIYIDAEYVRFQSALVEGYGVFKPVTRIDGLDDDFDFEPVQLQLESSGITLQNAQAAIDVLKHNGGTINKASVLRQMGYEQAGGNSKRINELWPQLIK